ALGADLAANTQPLPQSKQVVLAGIDGTSRPFVAAPAKQERQLTRLRLLQQERQVEFIFGDSALFDSDPLEQPSRIQVLHALLKQPAVIPSSRGRRAGGVNPRLRRSSAATRRHVRDTLARTPRATKADGDGMTFVIDLGRHRDRRRRESVVLK